jgi:hypothetical protein
MLHEPVPLSGIMDVMNSIQWNGSEVFSDSENFAQGGFGWCGNLLPENAVEIGFFKTEGLQAEVDVLFTWGGDLCRR